MNGYKLDLFGIYRQVVARGGWGDDDSKSKTKINWSREIFPKLANFTSTHKATSVGHDLIMSYKNYLLAYERKYASVDCNTDETKVRELINSIQRNTPRAGVTGTRSPGMTKRKPVGRPRASNLAGGNAGATGSAPVASRGGNRGGGRRKPKRTFPDGAKIKVFWPKENDWFYGTIVQQEYMPADGETYSKIEYEDGDEEVLNLSKEKVKLVDEKSDDDDDDDDDDGLVYVPRPTARRRGAAEPSRAPFAADTTALINAATGDFGDDPDEEDDNKDEGRRRTRFNGADPNAPEAPPPKERVELVEEMMEHHNAARVLAELPNEFCTEDETYRLGYRMGLRRMAKVSTAMLIEKMQKMLVAKGDDEAAKSASGCVLDEFFDRGTKVVSKEKAQALFNALIDAAYTPDKDAATYDGKGEPAMPKRAPEPEDPENMPGMVKEEEENANDEQKKKDDDGSGNGNGGDENGNNNKGPGPSSGGGNAGGANGEQKPDDTNKDNENNGGNNGDNEDDNGGATGFHASMLADKMDIDIPSPKKEKTEEPKKESPAVAPTRNSGRQRTVSRKVLEAIEGGLMKSPVKVAEATNEEPASKRMKTTDTVAAIRTMQTSVVHGGVEKLNPNKNEASTASPTRLVHKNIKTQVTTTNTKEEDATKKPAPSEVKQTQQGQESVNEDGSMFVPLPPVPAPPEWVGPVPTISNSDPEYLLYQLKVFIAKSGAVLDRAWRVTVAMRTQGASAGSYDATYWSPDNKRYRSRLEVARAIGVAPWVPPKKPKGEKRKPRDPNAPKRGSGGSGRSRGKSGFSFRRPLDSYPIVELKTPPPPPTQRVLCELLGDGTAVRWLEKHGLGEHAAAFVMHGIMRKNQLFAPLLMQDMENFGLDLETGAKVLKFIEETRQNASSTLQKSVTIEQLTPVPFGRRVTSEVFCDGREEYYDPGTFLFDESELAGRTAIGAANPLYGLIQA
mgnify:FL=1